MEQEKPKEKIDIPKELLTERLRLKPTSDKYSKEVFDNFTDEVTVLMFPSTPKAESETIEYLKGAEEKNKNGENYDILIFLKDTDEFIGGGGLMHIDTETPEFGIWIKKKAHGNRYGREAITALKEWADENLNYRYLKYPAEVTNIASRRIPESLGGKISKEYDAERQDGSIMHLVEYQISK